MFLVDPKVFSFVILTVHFLCRVLAAIFKMADILKILKTQNCSSNGDLSLCQILSLFIYYFSDLSPFILFTTLVIYLPLFITLIFIYYFADLSPFIYGDKSQK
jgi:hypothetical protein